MRVEKQQHREERHTRTTHIKTVNDTDRPPLPLGGGSNKNRLCHLLLIATYSKYKNGSNEEGARLHTLLSLQHEHNGTPHTPHTQRSTPHHELCTQANTTHTNEFVQQASLPERRVGTLADTSSSGTNDRTSSGNSPAKTRKRTERATSCAMAAKLSWKEWQCMYVFVLRLVH